MKQEYNKTQWYEYTCLIVIYTINQIGHNKWKQCYKNYEEKLKKMGEFT